jgi:cation diffusion facilitator family transporter
MPRFGERTAMDSRLHRRALLLSYFTVCYNVIEGFVSILAGALAGSIALVGFGLDSVVESLSGGVMIWRFLLHGRVSEKEEERIEDRATSLVGYTFLVLGGYVLYESLLKLLRHETPEPSLLGIAIAVVSLVVMPGLALAKHRTARAIGSRSLAADSKETLACAWLSVGLLVGLGLNYRWGIWWADPAVGLLVVAFLFREGYETLGEHDE